MVSVGNIGVNTGDGNIGISGDDMAAMYAAQARATEEGNLRRAEDTKFALVVIGGFLGLITLVWLIYQLLKS